MILFNEENEILKEAKKIIEKAKTIYFLGFGYDPINLSKLDIGLISKCQNVFGTTYEIPKAQISSIHDIFGQEKIKFSSLKVYDFLMREFDPNQQNNANIRFV